MKRYPTYLWIIGCMLLTMQLQAQSYTKKVLTKIPELEKGKVYTIKDLKAAQLLYPDGVDLDDETVYPFAKITGRRVVVILYFRKQRGTEGLHLDATTLRKKKLQPVHVTRYLCTFGKIGKRVYTSTISMDKKKIVSFNEVENGKTNTKRYRLEGKWFSLVSD